MFLKLTFVQKMFIVLVVASITGCASNPREASDDGFVLEEVNPDKFESFNRKVFAFNLTIDRWLLKPAARGYRWLAPEPVEIGVTNFFNNVGEVRNVVNDVLQWKWKTAGKDTGRFAINTTVGIFGLFDVAQHMGLPRSDGEDFGQTLAKWGVPQGPYVVLPFLGPATVRSGVGLPADWYVNPVGDITPRTTRYGLLGIEILQQRADLLEIEELAQGDLYLFMRDTYLQRRKFLVNDGVVVDDFGGDDFGDDEFDF